MMLMNRHRLVMKIVRRKSYMVTVPDPQTAEPVKVNCQLMEKSQSDESAFQIPYRKIGDGGKDRVVSYTTTNPSYE
jgi:hypothetical protein